MTTPLHVTAKGRRMLLKAPDPHAGLLVDALRHLPTSDLRRFRNAARALSAVLLDASGGAAGETLLAE